MQASGIERLAKWYESNCDGQWEHGYGVRITTLDNPGWSVSIDLKGTRLENVDFPTHEDNYQDERGWLRCWKAETTFRAACGPLRIDDALTMFCNWADAVNMVRAT